MSFRIFQKTKVCEKFFHIRFLLFFLEKGSKEILSDLHKLGLLTYFYEKPRLQNVVSLEMAFVLKIARLISRFGIKKILRILYNLLSANISVEIKEEIREFLETDESIDKESEDIDINAQVVINEEEINRCKYEDLNIKFLDFILKITKENINLKKKNFFEKIITFDNEDLNILLEDISDDINTREHAKQIILNFSIFQGKKTRNLLSSGEDSLQIYLVPFLIPSQKICPLNEIILSNSKNIDYIKKLRTTISFYFSFKPPVKKKNY